MNLAFGHGSLKIVEWKCIIIIALELSRNKIFYSGALFFFFSFFGKLRILKYLKILQGRNNGKERVNMNIYFLTTPLCPNYRQNRFNFVFNKKITL